MNDPIYEGVLLKLAEYNFDQKLVPMFYKLALQKNPMLAKAQQLIEQGQL